MPSFKLKLTKENLYKELNKIGVDDFTLFRFYLGHDFTLGKLFNSHFRQDNNASAAIKEFYGKLYYKDFGAVNKGMNIFEFILNKEYYPDTREGYVQVYNKIASDFNLNCFEGIEESRNFISNIIIKEKEKSSNKIIRYSNRNYFHRIIFM